MLNDSEIELKFAKVSKYLNEFLSRIKGLEAKNATLETKVATLEAKTSLPRPYLSDEKWK